ncbi:hypothetical protein [Tepidibacter mesophilus]|uniref:hypothetical protein n=1 Tax=Tepidibacter mesophilus TaxID=655607 RepID=UPI000C08529D|nr:hypothetical protein [Tepidibacter mesophilus]
MKSYKKIYSEINKLNGSIVEETFDYDKSGLLSKSHYFGTEYEKWIDLITNRKENILYKSALNEYYMSNLALVQGNYRHAFVSLRFFIEQTLFGIQLSINEQELKMWLNRKKDMYWSSIVNEESGIFSKVYIDVFCPNLSRYADKYRNMAKQVYRNCSEYIHGNDIIDCRLPEKIQFDEMAFNAWHKEATIVKSVVTFSMFVRYYDLLDNMEAKENFESYLTDIIGHKPEIQQFYDKECIA